MAIPRPLLAAGLLGCALAGGYATIGSIAKNGFGDAIFAYVVDPPHEGFPGAPKPLLREYTGVRLVDDVLAVLVGYFSGLTGGDVAPQYRLFAIWGMVQLAACWTLVALEGLRAGNKGRLVSWTGVMGLIVQVGSWTVVTPLWLILHLFTSPIAKLSPSSSVPASVLVIDLWDLAVLPLTVVLTYITPALPMMLPAHFGALIHYAATAAWQPFPLWHSIVQSGLSRLARFVDRTQGVGAPAAADTAPRAYLEQARGVYSFVTLLSVVAQTTILQLVLAPAKVRESLAATYPALGAYARPDVTFASVFVPRAPLPSSSLSSSYPSVDLATPLGSGELAPLAVHFLQYDIYFGCGAMLLWALYLHRNAVRSATGFQVAAKVAWWFFLGGFAGALSTLLWERDTIVEGGDKDEKKTN